jgi:glutamate/tyrosine decarboxylase-like PLP-dependent enzyme
MSATDVRGDAWLEEVVCSLFRGFERLPDAAASAGGVDDEAARRVLLEAAERMRDNYPYHHPLYVGQMLKPPHPVARVAYAMAMHLNPNNHALDGGRASSAMEKEAVAEIAAMFGWQRHLGHLTGGGTMANFEALWVARELSPGRAIAASTQAHYTHSRLSAVLGAPFRGVDVDDRGRMDPSALRDVLADGEVGTVVATLGTTAVGAVDPLPEILELREELGFRLHVDAAYAGYFRLVDGLDPAAAAAFGSIDEADSIVVDPHKHGLQPYGCGCVLFADPTVGRFYRHDSPYTYFSSGDLSLGEISLECSRAGASAVALWATQRLLPLERGGTFAAMLARSREAALEFSRGLERDPRFALLFPPQLDIVVWGVAAGSASEASRRARRIFEAAAERDLHLALADLPRPLCEASAPVETWDADSMTCLRACLMKAEHRDWLTAIRERLDAAADAVLGAS